MDSAKSVKFTIYCHTHTESGRRYIGLTKLTMMKRWNSHVYTANRVKDSKPAVTSHFANAIRKYGKDAFTHEVLEICYDLELANAAEQKWIEHFKTRDPQFGFNIAPGGSHTPHPVRNPWDRPEFRKKALASLAKANAVSREVRVQRANKLWQDPDFRKQISEVLRNNMSDPVIKERVMRGMRASLATPDSITKRSKISKRMWQSDDYRKRNAELWQDPGFRERCESGLRHGASLNASKTHCPHGHEYSPENTVINTKGSRECLECSRKSIRESARKIREEKVRIRGPIVVTHCINGHEYSPENVRMAKRGSRICLACMRKRSRERARMLRQRARSQPSM